MRVLLSIFLICFLFLIAVSAQTESSQTFFKQGTQAAQNQDYQSALNFYEQSLRFSNTESITKTGAFLAQLHYNIGVCHFQLNRPTEAVKEFTLAINLSDRRYQKAYYALGMAEAELKNWDNARAALFKSVRLNDRDGEAWFDLAMVLVREKDYENARRAFSQSIKYNSISKSAGYNNMGVISALSGDFQSAEKEFKLALVESDGKLIVAENNLQFCRRRTPVQDPNSLSKLEFTDKNNVVQNNLF